MYIYIYIYYITLINPQRVGTELIWLSTVNTMVADALAPSVAKTSAPMILTM